MRVVKRVAGNVAFYRWENKRFYAVIVDDGGGKKKKEEKKRKKVYKKIFKEEKIKPLLTIFKISYFSSHKELQDAR